MGCYVQNYVFQKNAGGTRPAPIMGTRPALQVSKWWDPSCTQLLFEGGILNLLHHFLGPNGCRNFC